MLRNMGLDDNHISEEKIHVPTASIPASVDDLSDLKRIQLADLATISHFAGATSVVGSEHANEDRFCCLSGQLGKLRGVSVFAVFDGHGGSRAAELASRRIPEILEQKLSDMIRLHAEFEGVAESELLDLSGILLAGELPSGLIQESLVSSFVQMERELLLGDKNDQSGSTALVCLIVKSRLYTATVGDSKAVLAMKTSLAKRFPAPSATSQLGVEHKPTRGQEKRRIEKAGGYVEDGRVFGVLAMSRCLGDRRLKGFTHKTAREHFGDVSPESTPTFGFKHTGKPAPTSSHRGSSHRGRVAPSGVARGRRGRGHAVTSRHKRAPLSKQGNHKAPRSTTPRAHIKNATRAKKSKKPAYPIGALIAEPHVSVLDLDPRLHKLLIVASDGLWDVMNTSSVVSLAVKHLREQSGDHLPDMFSLSSALARRAQDYLSADDITVIAVWFGEAP